MARDLEVRHCRVLLAVQAQGGVGAAARTLGVAQSTISEALLALERLVGAPITLRRPGREAALTPAGEALLPHARALVAASEAALAAIVQQSQATIRLGAVESISSFVLPAPLSAFRQEWPQVDVRITIGLCQDLRRRVDRSELDAALTIEAAARATDGDGIRELAPARLRLVAAPRHPLAGTTVTRSDLQGRTLLLTDPEGAFNDLLRAWIAAIGRPPKIESAGSVDGVKRAVLAGEAIGALPDYAIADELAAGALVALEVRDPPPPISLLLATPGDPPTASPLGSLIGHIRGALR